MDLNKHKVEKAINQIEVPPSIREFAKNIPQQYREGKLDSGEIPKLSAKNPRIWIPVGIAASLFAGMMMVSYKPAMAQYLGELPVVGSIIEKFGDIGLKSAKDNGMFSAVGDSVEDKGIEITIEDAFYDGARAAISYSVESKDPKVLKETALQYKLKAEGVNLGGSSSHQDVKISDSKVSGLINMSISDIKDHRLGDKLDLKLKITRVGDVDGSWNFEVPINAEIAKKNVKVFHPYSAQQMGDIKYLIKEIRSLPSSTQVYIESTGTMEQLRDIQYSIFTDNRTKLGFQSMTEERVEKNADGTYTLEHNWIFPPLNELPGSLILEGRRQLSIPDSEKYETANLTVNPETLPLPFSQQGKEFVIHSMSLRGNSILLDVELDGEEDKFGIVEYQSPTMVLVDQKGNRVLAEKTSVKGKGKQQGKYIITYEFEGTEANLNQMFKLEAGSDEEVRWEISRVRISLKQ